VTDRVLTPAVLRDLLREAGLLLDSPEPSGTGGEAPFTGVCQDSRILQPGDLFLAWAGTQHDAHDFLAAAAARGAGAAVVERPMEGLALPQYTVRDGRRAAALAADAFFGSPWRDLILCGVTGTNGKTTTALLLRHLLGLRGPAAALGTLGVVGADGALAPGSEGLTTPGPVELSRWLRRLADQGVRAVAMEASSHALEQRRLDGVRFGVAVFTNLTQDHLDYHRTMEAYREAKLHLLSLLLPEGSAWFNGNDPAWRELPTFPASRRRFAVLDGAAGGEWGGDFPELTATALQPGPGSTRFRLTFQGVSRGVELPLPGAFNVENALAAAGAALTVGMELEQVAAGLSSAPQVPGRLEVVLRHPFQVLIDFAHTPEALERILDVLRPLVPAPRRLIVVFGAGGDRDRGKRPRMGAAAERWADLVLVTSDNPRSEDPEAIIDEIVAGMEGGRHERIADRRGAIRRALELAGPGDLVVLAGKGHERTQTVAGQVLPFDERVVVRELMEELAA